MSIKIRDGGTITKDHGYKKFMDNMNIIQGRPHAKVGILTKELHPGDGDEKKPLTVLEIAAVNEFGSQDGRIPERSFIRSTADDFAKESINFKKKLLIDIALGSLTVKEALRIIGLKVKQLTQNRIKNYYKLGGLGGKVVKNAPSTVKAKQRKTGKSALIEAKILGLISHDSKFFDASEADTKELIDTGRLRQSINYKVIMK